MYFSCSSECEFSFLFYSDVFSLSVVWHSFRVVPDALIVCVVTFNRCGSVFLRDFLIILWGHTGLVKGTHCVVCPAVFRLLSLYDADSCYSAYITFI